jgi:hypothetical protein
MQHAASPFLHPMNMRCISQDTKDKVNARNESLKMSSSIEDRVKLVVSEQLGVGREKVCHPPEKHRSSFLKMY